VTLYLIRHGSAGRRTRIDQLDSERQLDEAGRRQSAAIADLLSDRPITLIAASPALRCQQTVEPLADVLGMSVVVEHSLNERTELELAWKYVEATASSHEAAVLCSHGDVIPEIINRAYRRGMTIPGKAGGAKGAIWTLRYDGEHFTTGVYTPVPA
jgi:8-oxo-dGTP diphosphatase